jgi:leucyl-tRNA synthetase
LVIQLKSGIDEKELLQKIKKNEKVNNYLNEKEIKKTIFIKDKLLNIIV